MLKFKRITFKSMKKENCELSKISECFIHGQLGLVWKNVVRKHDFKDSKINSHTISTLTAHTRKPLRWLTLSNHRFYHCWFNALINRLLSQCPGLYQCCRHLMCCCRQTRWYTKLAETMRKIKHPYTNK